MKRTPLVDKSLHHQCLGDLELSEHIYSLVEVEKYIITECTRRKVFWSYDVTADEPFPFHTINYSTFAGMITLTPLQPDLASQQMYVASRNVLAKADYVQYLRNRVSGSEANKYNRYTRPVEGSFDAIVVLPGDNKIKTHVCRRKLKQIIERHRDRVIFKPHPLTEQKTIDELKELIGASDHHFAPLNSDLYEILPNVDIVYTTHISESAIYATVLGKTISPIDQFDRTRQPGSFRHINQILFNEPSAIDLINTMFSSPMSGIICPSIEPHWKEKVDKYLDYILDVREHTKDFYVTE